MTIQTFWNIATWYTAKCLPAFQRNVVYFFGLPGPEEGCSMILRNFSKWYVLLFQKTKWDSLVGIEIRLPNIRLVFRTPVRDFAFLRRVQSGSGAQPALYLRGTEFFFLWLKWLRHEYDHSLPSSAKVEKAWRCTSSFPICLHGLGRDNYTFLTLIMPQGLNRNSSFSTSCGATFPLSRRPPPCWYFKITLTNTTLGRTSLDWLSARSRDFYLTTLQRDRHPCQLQESNPQSQQASRNRMTR